ncbi:MAG: hypothetical protein II942_04455 [Alphaproteobacteria bacterium]|nr:hypothetical protein [Alphaproteobacteria bacterium]
MKKLILLTTLALLGCATETKYKTQLNTWIQSSKTDLVSHWGVPDKTYKPDKETELLAYKRSTKINKVKYWCTTTFILKNNIVDSWKTEGNDCTSY